MRLSCFLMLVAVVFNIVNLNPSVAQEWSGLRGDDGLGSVVSGGILSKTSDVGFKLRWKRKIGSGYSSVVVSQDKVVTMYCDEANDVSWVAFGRWMGS